MPAFLTHWYVLIETARRSQDAGSDLGSLIMDTEVLRRRLQGLPTPPTTTPAGAVWATGPLPAIDYGFPGSDIPAMAFLGALAPDITSYRKNAFRAKVSDASKRMRSSLQAPADGSMPWERLLHTNRSGDFLLALLEMTADIPSPALRSQALAFAMGYLSHIASDIAINPYINALARTSLPNRLSGLLPPAGPHFYTELCLDECIAATYFARKLYDWRTQPSQPWAGYIEPVAHDLLTSETISAKLLDLLRLSAEATYGLSEAQGQVFRTDYLAGLHSLRLYLAGRGAFRWFPLHLRRVHKHDTATLLLALTAQAQQAGETTMTQLLEYAIRLSERLCRRAISYYASLRNSQASAEERNQRRQSVLDDVRNWDLHTGYALDVSSDQQVTLRLLHNWIHFADLWNNEGTPNQVRNLRNPLNNEDFHKDHLL